MEMKKCQEPDSLLFNIELYLYTILKVHVFLLNSMIFQRYLKIDLWKKVHSI